jgi:hypothetical protein
MDLLTQVLNKTNRAKFVPFSLPHKMALQNPEEAYSNLLKQHYQFLNDHFRISVVGLGSELHQKLPSNCTLKNIFLVTKLFVTIKQTMQTCRTGN